MENGWNDDDDNGDAKKKDWLCNGKRFTKFWALQIIYYR